MKTPQWQITDLEPGDRLRVECGEYFRGDWEGPRSFEVTVSSVYKTNNFGVVIRTREPFFEEECRLYVEDDWKLTYLNG